MIRRMARPLLAGIALALISACSQQAPVSSKAQEEKPDLSGWWIWVAPLGRLPTPFFEAPFKPPLAGAIAGMAAGFNAGKLPDPVVMGAKPIYCNPPSFDGFNGGFESAVEFLVTPGRVTITNEGGMIRRVAMDKTLPADIDATRNGTAVGHWEGKTLVIETAGLRGDNPLYITPFKLGDGAHVLERVSLTAPDTLEIATTLTAPGLFTKPFEAKWQYKRDSTHEFREYSTCEVDDRSIDPGTGRQRFELTPPADLPPPPAN